MKTNNTHKNDFSCSFAETLIAVLYNEATAVEQQKFENHIVSCASCRDEMELLSSTKNIVSEWRQTDFDLVEIESIIVPDYENANFKLAKKTFWAERLRAFLSLNQLNLTPSKTFAAMALAVILSTFVGYRLTNQFVNNEVAALSRNERFTPPAFSSPTPPPNFGADHPIQPIDLRSTAANSPTANVNSSNRLSQTGLKSEVKPDKSVNPKQPAAVKRVNNRQAPVTPPKSLDVEVETVEDLEDNSLRLSDLLDEVTPSI